jgi:aryl-alcohol dehydrogenase-like predicted oxidoreductase
MLPTKITVGCMNFGGRTPEAEARRIIDLAIERGATFFDTANMYEKGKSEEILGRALKGRRERVQVATKVGLGSLGGKPEGLAPQRIVAALDESLARLQMDFVDLYYLHTPDRSVSVDATLDGIEQVLRSGKARSWGISNHASWQILELDVACDARGIPKPVSSQVLYNLLIRQLDLEYFAFTAAHPIHTTVYNPLAGGLLARGPSAEIPAGSRFDKNTRYQKRYWTDAMKELVARYRELARANGMELLTFAYAWLAQRRGVDSIITGPASAAHLEPAFAAVEVKLPPEVVREVDAIHLAFTGTDARYAR